MADPQLINITLPSGATVQAYLGSPLHTVYAAIGGTPGPENFPLPDISVGVPLPDASPTSKGVVRLAGVLGGTAANPTAFGLTSADALTEAIQDTVAGLLRPGAGISLVYDDAANTLTISATGGSGTTPIPGFGDSFGIAFGGPA